LSTCERYEELISLSVSGELAPSEREQLRAHLAECEPCQLLLAREQQLWSMIEKSRRAEDVPPGLADRLAKGVGGQLPVAMPVRKRRWLIPAVAAAAALLLGLFLISRGEEPVLVATVTAGELLVHDGQGWRATREVYSGQFCRVAPAAGSEARLDLADGSKVRLERGMAFLLHRGLSREVKGERTVELLCGALTADVAKDKSENFVVDAPGGKVTATGTRFWVRAGPPEGKEEIMGKKDLVAGAMATALAVAVFEGSVLVNVKDAAAAEPVAIRAGEETKPLKAPEAKPQVGPRTVASAVPADALLFASAAGRAHWLKSVENSSLGAAYREEKIKAFVKPLIERAQLLIKDRKAKLEQNLGNTLKFSEIEAALQGEVGLAIVGMKAKAEGKKPEPVFLLVAEVGEHAEAFETGIGEFIKRVQLIFEQEGGGAKAATLTARTYRGTDLRTFSVGKTKIHYARTKGYFLLALDGPSVEKAIDCLEGKSRSLASVAGIKRGAGDLFKLSVDVRAWMKAERAKKPDNKQWRDFAILGFDQVKRLDYRLRFEKPLFHEELGVKLLKASGVLSLVEHAEPVDPTKLAGDVPANALAFAALRLPTARIIPTILKAMDAGNPEEANNFRKGLVEMKTHGLEIEAVLADALNGEIAAYAVPVPGSPLPDLVAVAGLKSNDKVLSSLKALMTFFVHQHARKSAIETTPEGKVFVNYTKLKKRMEKLTPQVVDYRGGKLLFVPVKERKPGQMVPAVLVLKNKLIVASTDAAAKRAAVRLGGAASLAGSAAFAASVKKLPAGPILVQYTDTASAFELLYALTAAQLPKLPLLKKLGVDPATLPPPGTIARHLKPEMTALYADAKGLKLRTIVNLPRAPIFVGMVAGEKKRKHNQRRDGGKPDGAEPGAGEAVPPDPAGEEF
jgi:FecR protein/Putative zinc-finger